jgi:hypothetical protein
MTFFALRRFKLCQRGISTGKQKICTSNGSKYCAKNECNTMISAPRWHKHPSSGANRPSDVGITVNFNTEFALKAVNPIIEYHPSDHVNR